VVQQICEKAISKSHLAPLLMIVGFISNHVIQELNRLIENGATVGQVKKMVTKDRQTWPSSAMVAPPIRLLSR